MMRIYDVIFTEYFFNTITLSLVTKLTRLGYVG